MKKQVVLLKGGEAKENFKDFYDFLEKQEYNPYVEKNTKWSDFFSKSLGDNYEVLNFLRPNSGFADYKAWKINFEKVFPFLKGDIIFVGHSMGGIFLAKYFEEEFMSTEGFNPLKIILIAPPFKNSKLEKLGTFNFKNKNFEKLKNIQEKIVIFGSKDDFVVPFEDIEDYKKSLTNAKFRIFENKGHFLDEDFDELIQEIKK